MAESSLIKAEAVEYFCCECDQLCSTPEDLTRHHRFVHGRRLSVCECCGAQFKNSVLLFVHCKYKHGVIKDMQCLCKSSFISVRAIKEHYQSCRLYKLVTSPSQAVAHMCHICGETFPNEKQYKQHKHSTDSKIYKCSLCDRSFNRASTLHNHERYVHTIMKLKCPFCFKGMKTRMGILYHVYSHREIGLKPEAQSMKGEAATPSFMCPLCDFTSTTKPSIKYHILTVHNFKKKRRSQEQFSGKKHINNREEEATSEKDGDTVDTEEKDSVKMDRELGCREEADSMKEDPDAFCPTSSCKCPICGRLCPDSGALRDHVALHEGAITVSCEYCDRGFVTKHAYRKHLRVNHSVYSGVKRQTPALSALVQCTVCGMKISRTGLAKHMDIHNGIYRYRCEYCDKPCRTNHDLTVHRRIHTGEKPFSCCLCGRNFSDQANLLHHRKRLHKETPWIEMSKARKTGFHKKLTGEELARMRKWRAENGLPPLEDMPQAGETTGANSEAQKLKTCAPLLDESLIVKLEEFSEDMRKNSSEAGHGQTKGVVVKDNNDGKGEKGVREDSGTGDLNNTLKVTLRGANQSVQCEQQKNSPLTNNSNGQGGSGEVLILSQSIVKALQNKNKVHVNSTAEVGHALVVRDDGIGINQTEASNQLGDVSQVGSVLVANSHEALEFSDSQSVVISGDSQRSLPAGNKFTQSYDGVKVSSSHLVVSTGDIHRSLPAGNEFTETYDGVKVSSSHLVVSSGENQQSVPQITVVLVPKGTVQNNTVVLKPLLPNADSSPLNQQL